MKRYGVRAKPSVFVVVPAIIAVAVITSGCLKSDNAMKLLSLETAVLAARDVSHPPVPGFDVTVDQVLSGDLSGITGDEINGAKGKLHIAYGHTSHGSQLITGMGAIETMLGNLYAFNSGGSGGALDLRDGPFSGASDLGNPDMSRWSRATRSYLNANSDINVVIWSWCGQVSGASEEDIDAYLNRMNNLEYDYPDVVFVYMTGHTDGSGLTGNLHVRNQQIRDYCSANQKVLFDFETIESSDPTAPAPNYFGDHWVTDGCFYDSNGDDIQDANWATEWITAHPADQLTTIQSCISDTPGNEECAHSRPLNCVMKGIAAWKLWVRIAASMP